MMFQGIIRSHAEFHWLTILLLIIIIVIIVIIIIHSIRDEPTIRITSVDPN